MACTDYLREDLRCAKGIPVTPRYGSFFCEGKHERCPFIAWEKSLKRKTAARSLNSFAIWRRT